MKNIHKILVVFVCGLLALGSCKEDKLLIYDAGSGAEAYFKLVRWPQQSVNNSTSMPVPGKEGEVRWVYGRITEAIDSLVCSFARVNPELNDTVILVPVSVMGDASSDRRDIAYRIKPSTTATQGATEDYEIVDAYIPAGRESGGILVRLYRNNLTTAKSTFQIDFQLESNEHFTLRYDSIPLRANVSPSDPQVSMIDFRLMVINELPMPVDYWNEGNYGRWSTKKALILFNDLNMPETQLYPEPGGRPDIYMTMAFGSLLKNYLQEKQLAGETIFEDDYFDAQGNPLPMDWGSNFN